LWYLLVQQSRELREKPETYSEEQYDLGLAAKDLAVNIAIDEKEQEW